MKKEYHIGTSGWYYRHWRGRFYPEDIRIKDWFDYYCKHFNTVEINNSFYRWPDRDTIRKWYEQAPAGFKYTLKAPRTITHIKRFKDPEKYLHEFYSLTTGLVDRTGCYLFQAPPSFECNGRNLERIGTFLDHLDRKRENLVEFRHSSWWNDRVYRMFEEKGAVFCTVSGLSMKDDVVVTGDVAYFRFHGESYSTSYTEDEITGYAREMEDLDCKCIYAYFNNDLNAYATQNATELKNILEENKDKHSTV